MAIQISSTAVIDNSRKGIFISLNPGVYTTATRPGSPSTADIIYNSTTGFVEYWNGSTWK